MCFNGSKHRAHPNISDYCFRKYMAILKHIEMGEFECFIGSPFKKEPGKVSENNICFKWTIFDPEACLYLPRYQHRFKSNTLFFFLGHFAPHCAS